MVLDSPGHRSTGCRSAKRRAASAFYCPGGGTATGDRDGYHDRTPHRPYDTTRPIVDNAIVNYCPDQDR